MNKTTNLDNAATTPSSTQPRETGNDKWRLAYEALTPQGSEFYNDLDRCRAYVEQQLSKGHEAMKRAIKAERKVGDLEAKLSLARAGLRRIADGEFCTEFGDASRDAQQTLRDMDGEDGESKKG